MPTNTSGSGCDAPARQALRDPRTHAGSPSKPLLHVKLTKQRGIAVNHMMDLKNSPIVSAAIILFHNERPWGDETVWYENPETNPLAQCLCQTGSEPGGLRIETAGQVVRRRDKAIRITGPICAKQIEAKSLCNGTA